MSTPRDSGDAVNEYLSALSTFVDERVKVALATEDMRQARMRIADAAGESLEIALRKALMHAAAGMTSRVPTFTAPTSRSSQRVQAVRSPGTPATGVTEYPDPFPLDQDSEPPPPSSSHLLPPLPSVAPGSPPSTMVGGFPKPEELPGAANGRRSDTGSHKA